MAETPLGGSVHDSPAWKDAPKMPQHIDYHAASITICTFNSLTVNKLG